VGKVLWLMFEHGLLSVVSVPKILTLFIPEILSHPAIAGRVSYGELQIRQAPVA
jgi:hypothetical protein